MEDIKPQRKQYCVRYYRVQQFVIDELVKIWPDDMLESESPGGTHAYTIQPVMDPVQKEGTPKVLVATLNKLRLRNLPKKRKLSEADEQDLDLEFDEGLVEKSYFALNTESKCLAIQQNNMVCGNSALPSIFAMLIKKYDKDMIVPIVTKIPDSDVIVGIECSYCPERSNMNVDNVRKESLGRALIDLHKMLGADRSQTVTIKLNAGKGLYKRKKFLDLKMLGPLKELKDKFVTAKVRIKIENGEKLKYELIDLIANHKKDYIRVAFEGFYPDEKEMIEKIKECASQN